MDAHGNFRAQLFLPNYKPGQRFESNASFSLTVDILDKETMGFSEISENRQYAWRYRLPWRDFKQAYIVFDMDSDEARVSSAEASPADRSPVSWCWIQIILRQPKEEWQLVKSNGTESWISRNGDAATFIVHSERYAKEILGLIKEIAKRQGARLEKTGSPPGQVVHRVLGGSLLTGTAL